MAKGVTPVQRTIKFLTDDGFTGESVERWVPSPKHPGGGFRKDYLNIIDMLFIKEGKLYGIQICGTDFSEHHKKIMENESNLRLWLSTGAKFYLIGWRKIKKNPRTDSKTMIWSPRVKQYTLEMLEKTNDSTA
jgi:hypothetical protein